jgi:hypothetical protein
MNERYLTPKEQEQKARRDRFENAEVVALSAVTSLNQRRDHKRSVLLARGDDPSVVIAGRVAEITDLLVRMFNPEPAYGQHFELDPNPFEHDDAENSRQYVPVLLAVVWELWRDYQEWPDGSQIADRLVTWLNVPAKEARQVVTASLRDPWRGQRFNAEPAPGLNSMAPPEEYRWYIHDIGEAYFQEELFQWRKLLADECVPYQVPFVSFASENRQFWRLPA